MSVSLLFLHLQACERIITFASMIDKLIPDQTRRFWDLLNQMSDHLKSVRDCKVVSPFNVPPEQSIKGPLTRLPQALDALIKPESQEREYAVIHHCIESLRDIYINPPPALLQSKYEIVGDARKEAEDALRHLEQACEPSGASYTLL